jgi:DNA-binding NarL/FixJ family response regulator
MSWILPNIMIGLGTTTLDLGDPEQAITYFREGIALAQARGNLGDVIDAIEGLARVAAATGQAEQAVRLFGATDAIRTALATPFLPSEHAQFDPIVNGLRDALGREGFAEAWASGRALSQEEALATALAIRAEPAVAVPPGPDAFGLTGRELDILRLIAAGHSNRELGDLLYISPTTAARHVANIYRKLGIDSRVKATAFARQHGIV